MAVSSVTETPLSLTTVRLLSVQVIFHTHKICTDFKTIFHITKIIAVDVPEWLPFGDWSECTASRGQGSKVRARACSHPPINGSEQCSGDAFEFANCTLAGDFSYSYKKIEYLFIQQKAIPLYSLPTSMTLLLPSRTGRPM